MGVDFYECDCCGECVYEGNISYIESVEDIVGPVCRLCVKRYFVHKVTVDDMDNSDFIEGFYVQTLDGRLLKEQYPCDLESEVDDISKCYTIFIDKNDTEEQKKARLADVQGCWYDPGDWDVCVAEALYTFETHLEKTEKLEEVAMLHPNAAFKRVMLSRVDDQVRHLTGRKRKLAELVILE